MCWKISFAKNVLSFVKGPKNGAIKVPMKRRKCKGIFDTDGTMR